MTDATIEPPEQSGGFGLSIFEQHAALLRASAISVVVARARGYVSVSEKTMLARYGFSKAQQRVPGLLVPRWLCDGRQEGWQYRPDSPRVDDHGRARKYENPYKQASRLDVHPAARDVLADPSIPLWLTEGARKADAAITVGISCCISLAGVDCWRGRNDVDGLTALADWHEIALNGREVVVCFDGDVMAKEQVHAALRKLAGYLRYKDARVRYCLLPLDGPKGLDDFLGAGGARDDLEGLVVDELPTLGRESSEPPRAGGSGGSGSHPSDARATVPPVPVEPPRLAYDLRILDRFRVDVRRCGVVGEETTAAIVYLTITSRLLDRPVSAAVKGHSASGKSFSVETTCQFFPRAALLVMTAMSERALVYSTEDYRHRTIIMYEVVALKEGAQDDLTSYFVRSLLSEGRIEYPVTVRDKDGGFVTKTIVKEGPTGLIFTTTKTKVHAENETRVLSLSTDDSREQTARVFRALADETAHGVDLTEWQRLQTWLQDAEHRVTIPYAGELAKRMPPVAVRLRRDFGAVLSLIRAHAILHQVTRDRDDDGRIVASVDDYEIVRDLISDVISEGVGATVSATVRETVDAVAELECKEGVTAQAIGEHLKLDKSAARRRLRAAADDGYVRNLEDRRGQPGRWVVGDPMPETADLLPPPCHLFSRETAGEPSGGTVASDFEGIEREPVAREFGDVDDEVLADAELRQIADWNLAVGVDPETVAAVEAARARAGVE